MSHRIDKAIKISGDGNAIGNGNTVTIIKHTTNNQHTVPSNDDDGGGIGGIAIIGVMMAALGLAALAFWFGKHANVIYYWQLVSAIACALVAGIYLIYSAYRGESSETTRSGILVILGVILALAVKMGSDSYSNEWQALAESAQSAKQFWCALSFVDQQGALQHALQALLLLAPSTLFVLLHIISLPMRSDDCPGWLRGIIRKLTGTTSLVITAGCCVLSFAAHTDTSFGAWQNNFNSQVSLVCPSKKL